MLVKTLCPSVILPYYLELMVAPTCVSVLKYLLRIYTYTHVVIGIYIPIVQIYIYIYMYTSYTYINIDS